MLTKFASLDGKNDLFRLILKTLDGVHLPVMMAFFLKQVLDKEIL